jgi:uroporphyrin-III C-methyltransferase
LQAQGIATTVVNGITSGLAAVTQLGCALTHREHAQGVMMVTGHAKPGGQLTDWARLGQTAQAARLTLVIYMGAAAMEDIQAGLLHSMPQDTPAALIQGATTQDQKTKFTTLGHMAQDMKQAQIGSPCIIAVGEVLSAAAAWSMQDSEPHACEAGPWDQGAHPTPKRGSGRFIGARQTFENPRSATGLAAEPRRW